MPRYDAGSREMNEDQAESYQQVAEIITHLAELHAKAAQLCRVASTSISDEQEALGATTLADRQQDLAEFLERTRSEAEKSVLTTWSQFIPNEPIEALLDQMRQELTSFDVLAEYVIDMQNEIANAIEVVADGSSSPQVQEFLESVATREHAEAKFVSEAELGIQDV